MKVEARIFEIVTVFCFVVGIIYTVLTGEAVGVAGLFLTGGLTLIIGTYLRFVARRLEIVRPEDNAEAEVSDGAGDVGFFSPGSYWPITLAGSAALLAISVAFYFPWAITISVVILLLSIGGLVFEYHIKPADH